MSASAIGSSSVGLPYIVTSSDSGNCEQLLPFLLDSGGEVIRKSDVLKAIEKEAEKIRKSRRENGWHDAEKDRWRSEKYEQTVAKLYALTLIFEAVVALPECENLTFEKPTLPFSGSAEEQPLKGEVPAVTGKIPVTRPETLPSFFDSLSIADLHSVSELALEAMERRPEAQYDWTVADRFQAAVRGL